MTPAIEVELPWLREQMASLAAVRRTGRLPHSLLLQGSAGIGADWLAQWIARLLLCTTAGHEPCGRCRACSWVSEEQHPDLLVVRAIEDSRQIRIEQIRDLSVELGMKSHQGGSRVGVIHGADALNRFAANALLKTLEEPRPDTVLILTAALPSRLPATVRSRCQVIRLRQPARAACLTWLEALDATADWAAVLDVVGDNPLAAREVDAAQAAALRAETVRGLEQTAKRHASPLELAEAWSRSELALRLRLFETWLTNRIRAQALKPVISAEMRPVTQLHNAGSIMNIGSTFELLDGVRELQALLDSPINRSLALERLLLQLAVQA